MGSGLRWCDGRVLVLDFGVERAKMVKMMASAVDGVFWMALSRG